MKQLGDEVTTSNRGVAGLHQAAARLIDKPARMGDSRLWFRAAKVK
jgi:hypothetical protein